jgi:4-amino-4-deoxychorismate lyase
MSLLLESIKLEDGVFNNLSYHEQRMNHSLKVLCGSDGRFNLEEFLAETHYPRTGLYKCRMVYDDATRDVEFIEYKARPVKTLQVVESDRITYSYKYANRKELERLFEKRQSCDDILILRKGIVTDTSYANIVFKRGKNWYTPWSPLLKGTMRAFLLERNIIMEEQIRLDEIQTFDCFKLVNAMLAFDSPEQKISGITF